MNLKANSGAGMSLATICKNLRLVQHQDPFLGSRRQAHFCAELWRWGGCSAENVVKAVAFEAVIVDFDAGADADVVKTDVRDATRILLGEANARVVGTEPRHVEWGAEWSQAIVHLLVAEVVAEVEMPFKVSSNPQFGKEPRGDQYKKRCNFRKTVAVIGAALTDRTDDNIKLSRF